MNRKAKTYFLDKWKAVKIAVYKIYSPICMKCGGIDVLHVDHIKPKSKFPELALDINNLQVLCEECNMAKGNKYVKDFRSREDIQCLVDLLADINYGWLIKISKRLKHLVGQENGRKAKLKKKLKRRDEYFYGGCTNKSRSYLKVRPNNKGLPMRVGVVKDNSKVILIKGKKQECS